MKVKRRQESPETKTLRTQKRESENANKKKILDATIFEKIWGCLEYDQTLLMGKKLGQKGQNWWRKVENSEGHWENDRKTQKGK